MPGRHAPAWHNGPGQMRAPFPAGDRRTHDLGLRGCVQSAGRTAVAVVLAVVIVMLPSGRAAGSVGGGSVQSELASGSAHCDGIFHFLYVPGAENLDGSPTGIEYICQTGSAHSPLLVYMDGGGACTTGDGCLCQPDASGSCTNPGATITQGDFNKAVSDDGRTWAQTYFGGATSVFSIGAGSGAAAFAGPTSPFNQSWNIVYIPATTGDGYLGDRVRQLTTSSGHTYAAHFVGYRNVQLFLREIGTLFPDPAKVAAWGASGGGVGLTCSLRSFRATWPDAPMWMMDNAGPAYGTDDLMPLAAAAAHLWGAWVGGPGGEVIPETCPVIPTPGSGTYSLEWVVRYDALVFPGVIKAFTDDYSDYAADFTACLFGAIPNAAGSCASAVTSTLVDEYNDVIRSAPNFKVFYHTGICHIERESDNNSPATDGLPASCDYDLMQQPPDDPHGTHFNQWVNAWITDSPAWVNVT
jgi:hypothetical protein